MVSLTFAVVLLALSLISLDVNYLDVVRFLGVLFSVSIFTLLFVSVISGEE